MAYYTQAQKKIVAPKVKYILEKYNIKATLAVRNNSTIVLNIKSGNLDFIGNYNSTITEPRLQAQHYIQVNEYTIGRVFSGKCRAFLVEIKAALNFGNHDNSDIMTDYFDVGWYIEINIGRWDKPYIYTKGK